MDLEYILPLFEYANRDNVLRKLRNIIAGGKNRLHLLLDFDRTMTAPSATNGADITAWDILKSYLPTQGIAAYDRLFQKYRSIELAGSMKTEDAQAWWHETLSLYRDYRVNMNDVKRSFLSHTAIRPGTAEIFGYCRQNSVPAVVISAGIKDVISLWLEHYHIRPDAVISTELLLDPGGAIAGWKPETLVHILNKNESGHRQLAEIRATRPNTILIGDGLSDAEMAGGDTDVLRIRISDPRTDETVDDPEYGRKTFERFDLLITGKSLVPLMPLLEAIS